MVKEIERKFLIRENRQSFVEDLLLKQHTDEKSLIKQTIRDGKRIIQGYVPKNVGDNIAEDCGLKIDFEPEEYRLRKINDEKFIFGVKNLGDLIRDEIEIEIDKSVFNKYWNLTEGRRLEKFRLKLLVNDRTVEVDNYSNRDLVLAEVEFSDIQSARKFPLLGKDVTNNPAYKNRNLACENFIPFCHESLLRRLQLIYHQYLIEL
jgi:CYTH domain-containing protein